MNMYRTEQNVEVFLQLSPMNERDLRHYARMALRKLLLDSECERIIRTRFEEARAANRCVLFADIWEILVVCGPATDAMKTAKKLNARSMSHVTRMLGEFFRYECAPSSSPHDHDAPSSYMSRLNRDSPVFDFSGLFVFAKQTLSIFRATGLNEMPVEELEAAYVRTYQLELDNKSGGVHDSISVFPARALGYVESSLLFAQGLGLMMNVKKMSEHGRVVVLNRDFRRYF